MRVLGVWLESVLCSGRGGRIWGCSILASSQVRLRRILSSKLGPLTPPLGPLAPRLSGYAGGEANVRRRPAPWVEAQSRPPAAHKSLLGGWRPASCCGG